LPETCLSPEILSLRFIEVPTFILLDTLLLFTIGLLGCRALACDRRFSVVGFSLLFLLFNFNGYISSRMAVGHRMWEAYFYLPWFFCFLLRFLAQVDSRRSLIGVAAILVLILAQGGLHIYVWCLMLLGLLALFNLRLAGPLAFSAISSVAVSAYRIIPGAFFFADFRKPFVAGYPSLTVLLDALLSLKSFRTPVVGGTFGEAGWWEYDLYIGFAGGALLLLGLWASAARDGNSRTNETTALWVALSVLAFLSFGDVFILITRLPLPFACSERVPSRLITLPFVFAIFSAAEGISRRGTAFRIPTKTVIAVLFAIIIGDLWLHLDLWRLAVVEDGRSLVAPSIRILASTDTWYHGICMVSFVLSIASAGAYVRYLWAIHRSQARLLATKGPTATRSV